MDNQNLHNYKFFTTSVDAWNAMLEAILNAKESIDIEQFIFSYDSVGIRFIEVLKKKAIEGIRIRIFCDTVGSFALSKSSIIKELKRFGIKIKFFNPITPWHPNNESLWYFRDHRKLMVVDNVVGFTGGACLGEEMRNWRESHVMIKGDVVIDMKESFEIMWNKSYRKLSYLFKRSSKDFSRQFRYVTNSPLPRKRYMYRELIRAVKSARHYIYLTTPYLLPDSRLLRNLKRASRRGVEIRIVIPYNANHKIVDFAMETFFEDLLSANIRIFRYKVSMIHSKTAVIDGTWSTIGSLNLDNLSLRYNFEGNIVSNNREFAFELEKQFLIDVNHSEELTLEVWRRRSLIQKLAEILVWPIRKFL